MTTKAIPSTTTAVNPLKRRVSEVTGNGSANGSASRLPTKKTKLMKSDDSNASTMTPNGNNVPSASQERR